MSEIEAASGYWSDIQDAIDLASPGDTVVIPAGTFNFIDVDEVWGYDITGFEMVNVPADINVRGATTSRTSGYDPVTYGRNLNNQVVEWLTKLVVPWAAETEKGVFFKFEGDETADHFNRIWDIAFIGYYNAADDEFQRQKYKISAIFEQYVGEFRIDHCYFENLRGGAVKSQGTTSHGVIDHCHYYLPVWLQWGAAMNQMDVGYAFQVEPVYFNKQPLKGDPLLVYWDADDQNVFGQYTDYSLFIEDCLIDGGCRHVTASNWGGHYVFRHSTIQNGMGFGEIDAHGWSYYVCACPIHGGATVYTNKTNAFVTHMATHGWSEVDALIYWEANKIVGWLGTRGWELYNCLIKDSDTVQSTGGYWATFGRGGHNIHFVNQVGGGGFTSYIYTMYEGDILDTDRDGVMNGAEPYSWVDLTDIVLTDECAMYANQESDDNTTESLPEWYAQYIYPHPLNTDSSPTTRGITRISGGGLNVTISDD